MKKQIVISAINFFEGGPLSVLKDCLAYLNNSIYADNYSIIAFVHKEELFDLDRFNRITFKELPESRKSYLYRFYYEYYYFRQYAKKNDIAFWLSLHDMTPGLVHVKQAVYCHNPSVFNENIIKEAVLQPKQLLFSLFYKYIYQINIHRNAYIIVQQQWMKKEFQTMFGLKPDKIIVAKPQIPKIKVEGNNKNNSGTYRFFYPAYPRSFKNIELICKAVEILNRENVDGFTVELTIKGTENNYSRKVFNAFKNTEHIQFLGLISRDEVFKKYAETDCLIFPSKLETWGLPISEFQQFNKPMLLADCAYAKETAAGFNKVKFFNINNPEELARYMQQLISQEKLTFSLLSPLKYTQPYSEDWAGLFSLLLN